MSYKKPDICIPLTGKNLKEIKEQLDIILPKKPNLIELRADFLDEINNTSSVLNIINTILNKTSIPLLFTIRSSKEGGELIELDELEVLQLLKEVCQKTKVSMIDYELESKQEYVKELLLHAKETNKKVILSYHNFNETPRNEVLIDKLILMEKLGAAHAKIAVMPNNQADVFRLLDVTLHASRKLNIPLTTMSMGDKGKLSRVIGWIYGSKITFAVGARSSAPGQIEIERLQKSINEISNSI